MFYNYTCTYVIHTVNLIFTSQMYSGDYITSQLIYSVKSSTTITHTCTHTRTHAHTHTCIHTHRALRQALDKMAGSNYGAASVLFTETTMLCEILSPKHLAGSLKTVDWTTGLDYWTGLLDWITGLARIAVKCLLMLIEAI